MVRLKALRAPLLFISLLIVALAYLLAEPSYPPVRSFLLGSHHAASAASSKRLQALVVTAHPDDECMFFSPAILGLIGQGVEVRALSVSTGNAEGKGEIRTQELKRSYKRLGVKPSHVIAFNHPRFQDSMTSHWPPRTLSGMFDTFFTAEPDIEPDLIITFDKLGITGHPNHTPLSTGLGMYLTSDKGRQRHPHVRLFVLETVPVVQKFTGAMYPAVMRIRDLLEPLLDTQSKAPTRRINELVFTSSINGYLRAVQAMLQHRTQLVWFRWLYVAFSKYMWTVRLLEIDVS